MGIYQLVAFLVAALLVVQLRGEHLRMSTSSNISSKVADSIVGHPNDVHLQTTTTTTTTTLLITTLAGTNVAGSSGDKDATPLAYGVATSAQLNTPKGVAADSSANIYIADYGNNKIRFVNNAVTNSAGAFIITFAGTGIAGSSGDGGAATSAQLNGPTGVATDSSGVYIVDSGNNRIRKVSTTGIITTIAGTGSLGSPGNGPAVSTSLSGLVGIAVNSAGTLFFGELDPQNTVLKVSTPGTTAGTITTFAGTAGKSGLFWAGWPTGDGGPATSADLRDPNGIATDSNGNVYICDTGNHMVRIVSSTGTINTFAGTQYYQSYSSIGDGGPAISAQLGPTGIALNNLGIVYIVDSVSKRIRMVTSDGIITTFAGTGGSGSSGDGGAPTSCTFVSLAGIAVDKNNRVYVTDSNKVRMISLAYVCPAGFYVSSTTVGTCTSCPIGMYTASPTTATSCNLCPTDTYMTGTGATACTPCSTGTTTNYVVGAISSASCVCLANTYMTSTGCTVCPAGTMNFVIGATSADSCSTAFAQRNIVTVVGTGDYTSTVEGLFGINTQVNHPNGVAVDSLGNLFYLDNTCRVHKWTRSTGIVTPYAGKNVCDSVYIGDGGPATRAELARTPIALAVDTSNNNLYIADQRNNVIRLVTASTGIITTYAGTQGSKGASGPQGSTGDNFAATSALLNRPSAVAVGLSGTLYIADSGNYKVRKVTSSGIITTFAGTGVGGYTGDGGAATSAQLFADTVSPHGIATDAVGKVYIADSGNYIIRMVSITGIITTIAGIGGSQGSTGDGGPATSAQLYQPIGIALDISGNLYIADGSSNIRMVSNSATRMMFTVAGNGIAADGLDDVAATSCSLYNANAIAIDVSGNIFVSDSYNFRIRMMYDNSKSNGLPVSTTTTAGTCAVGMYAQSSSVCVMCPAGSYTAVIGSTICSPCSAGQFSNPGATVCTSCSA